jgi:hypothetical protein
LIQGLVKSDRLETGKDEKYPPPPKKKKKQTNKAKKKYQKTKTGLETSVIQPFPPSEYLFTPSLTYFVL